MKLSFNSPCFRKLYAFQEGKCFYCSKVMLTEEYTDITRDHFVPLSKGGKGHHKNIVLSCAQCNADFKDKIKKGDILNKFKVMQFLIYGKKETLASVKLKKIKGKFYPGYLFPV